MPPRFPVTTQTSPARPPPSWTCAPWAQRRRGRPRTLCSCRRKIGFVIPFSDCKTLYKTSLIILRSVHPEPSHKAVFIYQFHFKNANNLYIWIMRVFLQVKSVKKSITHPLWPFLSVSGERSLTVWLAYSICNHSSFIWT